MEIDLSLYPHRFPREIYLYETDAFGHLNNVHFIAYMEGARFDLFKRLGLFNPKDIFTLGYVLARIECDYRRIVRYGERLTIYTGVQEIGSSSFTLGHVFLREDDGEIVATGKAVLVAFDHQRSTPKPLQEEVVDKLRRLKEYIKGD